jgi:hypothetical protein
MFAMPQTGQLELERAELQRILESRLFTRAPSLGKLLSYLCHKYFNGEVDQIKEYTIAVELYGRSTDFHSKEDPIVRVEANRLRNRLKEYYHTEGRSHPVQVCIPSGQYAPLFRHRHQDEITAGPEPEEVPHRGNLSTMEPGHHVPDATFAGSPAVPVSEARGTRPRLVYIAAFSIVGIVVLLAIAWIYLIPFKGGTAPSSDITVAASTPVPVPPVPGGPELRIMAGSNLEKYVDRFGKVWASDRYFKGGNTIAFSRTALQRAEQSHLCRVARVGDFDYEIPLNPGVYELHLYFAEMQFGSEPEEGGETSRIFDVYVNGTLILERFDIFADAGGGGIVDERVFKDISPAADGRLHLSFRSFKDDALLSGIEIVPGIPGRLRPIRITTRTSSYLSPDQQLWGPDRFFRGGRSVVRLNPVGAARDPELYQSERYGNFSYIIPVAEGSYTATLKFAETYFGPTHPRGEGPETRIFDVYCNGQTVLKNFNISSEAGGVNRSIDKVFRRLQPNAQGKLVFHFVPVNNYACINAIEIVPE